MKNQANGGTGARLGAKLIDQLMVALVLVPAFGWSLWVIEGEQRLWMGWAYLAYFLFAPIAYETFAYWFFGRTVGKWVYGLKLVSFKAPGRELSVEECLLRVLAERLSFYFSAGIYAIAWLRRDRRHFADWVAGTQVVRESGHSLEGARRPFVGLAAIVVFSLLGWGGAAHLLSRLQWDLSGITLNF